MLIFHQSNRLENLAGALSEIIQQEPPADAFARESIIVLSRPMQHWLSLRLADDMGIWANADFPFPNHFLGRLFEANLGIDKSDVSPYDPAVLTWAVMQLLDSRLPAPGFGELKSFLRGDDAGLKRLQLSRRIADLFDQYMVYRPDMIQRWDRGETNDGWQAELWRDVVKQQGTQHRAALEQEFLQKVAKSDKRPEGLPDRISMFGICALSPLYLNIFEALGRFVPVHIFMLNPCREYWGDIQSRREIARRGVREGRLVDMEKEHFDIGNSFLASMGHLGREFMDLILKPEECDERTYFEDPGRDSLLASIQSEILNLEEPGDRTVRNDDLSIQVHCCHSPMREVEVLHDRLLDLFERNPDLGPRDVIVMAPNIESYAPYVQAVFTIPFAIADQSAKYASPVVDAFFGILDLPLGRFTSTGVMRILEIEAVHKRFDLGGTDLETIRQWLSDTNVHWGIDAEHRRYLDLPGVPENSWRWALDRMLLGYAMPGGGRDCFDGILPYDEIEGGSARVLGSLAKFVDELAGVLRDLQRCRTVEEWGGTLNRIIEDFIVLNSDTQDHVVELRKAVNDWERHAAGVGFDGTIDLKVVRAALSRLVEAGNPRPFLTHGVNFSAFVPLRSIPFRVVCLLGLNNSDFPRMDSPLRFDLIRNKRRAGDRSRRDDDRYLFLEALISARDTLYISYVGRSLRDNSEIPPSVLVSELLDYIVQDDDENKLRERLEIVHPLQPFSPRYFRTGGDAEPGLFSFSDEFCRAGISLAGEKKELGFLFTSPIDPPEESEWTALTLDSLIRFYECPVKFLLTWRMGIRLASEGPALEETESFKLEALELYAARSDLIDTYLAGVSPEEAERVMKAGGRLPHGTPGAIEFRKVSDEAQGFLKRVREARESGLLDPLDIYEEVAGLRFSGRLQDICRDHLLHYRCGSIQAKDKVRAWIGHVVLNAFHRDGYPTTTMIIGRGPKDRYVLNPLEDARDILEGLVGLYRDGLNAPLPFFPAASWAFAENPDRPKPPMFSAVKIWEGGGPEGMFYNQGERYRDQYRDFYELTYGAAGWRDILNDRFRSAAEMFYRPMLDVIEQVK